MCVCGPHGPSISFDTVLVLVALVAFSVVCCMLCTLVVMTALTLPCLCAGSIVLLITLSLVSPEAIVCLCHCVPQ